jgi:hypothetical protein
LFVLKQAYENFAGLPPTVQNRILLAFDVNPENENEKVHWEKFTLFRKIVISN